MTINKGLMSSKSDEWETPQALFDALHEKYNFVLDVCATKENTKVDWYYWKQIDGLLSDWTAALINEGLLYDGAIWMNPPYSNAKAWIEKAAKEAIKGATVVCLLPYRPDTRAWFAYIWDSVTIADFTVAYQPKKGVDVIAIKGRLKFNESKNSAPFPSVVVVFKGAEYEG